MSHTKNLIQIVIKTLTNDFFFTNTAKNLIASLREPKPVINQITSPPSGEAVFFHFLTDVNVNREVHIPTKNPKSMVVIQSCKFNHRKSCGQK